jgi:hypothetical protein
MSEDTIVPFATPAAKRANDLAMARMQGVPAADDGNPNIAAIEQMLVALEGMQTNLQTLTELVVEQDKRIAKLEKARSRIISARD